VSNEVPLEDRMESTSFRELNPWRLTGDEKNFWKISDLFLSSAALISLLMLQLFRRSWHKVEEREERLKELKMITLQSEVFVQEMRGLMDHVQETHKEHCAEFQKQMDILKRTMRRKDTPSTDFQNVMDIVQTAKVGDGRCDKLQNQMDLLQKTICVEEKRYLQLKKEINTVKLLVKKRLPAS
jgi:hypothetical protein